MHPALKTLADRIDDEIRRDMEGDKLIWPSVPQVVLRIRKVLEKPDASVDEMTRAIASDPALSARLLRVANSVYYGTTPCRSLRAAVVRLGADALQNAAMMVVVARVFAVGKRRALQPHLHRLWMHSTLVAALAELLAARHPDVEPDVAMLAGLIHDIGEVPVLLAAWNHPRVFGNRALLDPLVEHLHAGVGARVLASWRLPGEYASVAGAHAQITRKRGGPVTLLDVVMAADIAVKLSSDREEVVQAAWRLPALRRVGVSPPEMWVLMQEAETRQAELDDLLGLRSAATA